MAELIYIILCCICHTIGFFNILAKYDFNFTHVLVVYIIVMVTTILSFLYYKKTKDKKTIFSKKFRIKVNSSRLHIFIFILALASLIYTVMTGVGRAESYVTASFSQIFSFFNINSIFIIYYAYSREKHSSRIMWINIGLYILLKIVQGWTSILLQIFFFELYYWLKKKGIQYKKLSIKAIIFGTVLMFIILFSGASAYKYMYVVKYSIRNSTEIDLSNGITLSEGFDKLTSRMTYMDSATKYKVSEERIMEVYNRQGNKYLELSSMLRPIVPRTFMPNKTFKSLGSSIYEGISGLSNYNVTDSIGIFYFIKLIFNIDAILGIIWISIYIFSYKFVKGIVLSMQEYEGQFEFFLFWLTVSYTLTGNIETLFTQTYFKLLFFIPVFWLLGIFKIYIKEKRIYQ